MMSESCRRAMKLPRNESEKDRCCVEYMNRYFIVKDTGAIIIVILIIYTEQKILIMGSKGKKLNPESEPLMCIYSTCFSNWMKN